MILLYDEKAAACLDTGTSEGGGLVNAGGASLLRGAGAPKVVTESLWSVISVEGICVVCLETWEALRFLRSAVLEPVAGLVPAAVISSSDMPSPALYGCEGFGFENTVTVPTAFMSSRLPSAKFAALLASRACWYVYLV